MEKKRILIIDDEESFTRIIKLNLESTGRYEVKIENKGSQGLTVAKAFRPDLILLDIIMPDMEGNTVALEIKKDVAVQNIPIVFLTVAITKEEIKVNDGAIGGYSFLSKPVSLQELIDCIEQKTISRV